MENNFKEINKLKKNIIQSNEKLEYDEYYRYCRYC